MKKTYERMDNYRIDAISKNWLKNQILLEPRRNVAGKLPNKNLALQAVWGHSKQRTKFKEGQTTNWNTEQERC